jgi:alkaline phosphatase D
VIRAAARRRRWLVRLSVALLLLGAVPSGIGPARPVASDPESGLLVTVAEVRGRRAVLWLRASADERLRVRVAPLGDPAAGVTFAARTRPDWDGIFRLPLDGLVPGTRYAYEVTGARAQAAGAFTSAPAPDADMAAHLLWSGDLGGAGHCRDVEDGYPIFRAMARQRADLFLFVGDTVYADHVCGPLPHVTGSDFVASSLAEYRAKHRYNRADPAFQELLRTTPVYAIWDDHEVRNNFVGADDPLMPLGRRAFRDYWAIEGPAAEPDRLYRSVRWGRHAEIFVLDTRQYRSRNTMPDGPGKTMLGADQRQWLLDGVTASSATWKIIVTSVPLGMFTGGRFSDSWSSANVLGYPRPGHGFVWERSLILNTLRAHGVRNVVFLTGDVHHAELLRHDVGGYVVHEFVAGPLSARHGFPRFGDRSLATRSLGSLGFANNFGEIIADHGTLTARIRDSAGTVRARVQLIAETTEGERL